MNEQVFEQIEMLKKEALGCTQCGLADTRMNVVFGEGNPDTPLMLVGEGPGSNEDATGRPFVGRAGALLDECLRENSITRKHIYIANIVKCRPSITENSRTRNRPPSSQEAVTCLTWLEKQISIIQPLVIVCLGAVAANHIIRPNFRMTVERGQWFPSKYARYAIAALHPAYILRQDGQGFESCKNQLISDLAEARKKVIEARKEAPETLF